MNLYPFEATLVSEPDSDVPGDSTLIWRGRLERVFH